LIRDFFNSNWNLIPKGLLYWIWQHSNFGQICMIRDFHVLGPNLNRSGQEISFMCTKIQDIWKYESNVMVLVCYFLFVCSWAILGRSKKKFRKKIRNWFSRFIYTWKALNHSILINESKVMSNFCLQVVMVSLL